MNLAESRREASDEEIQRIREHVAAVGFDSGATTKAGSQASGITWQARLVHSSDRLDNATVHYLRHVLAQPEWQPGTTIAEYIASLRSVIKDPNGGILLTRRYEYWILTFVAAANDPVSFVGRPWIAVGYGVHCGYWTTGYRPRFELTHFSTISEEGEGWLRRPRNRSV
jgi:hypothetical protein